MKHNLVAHNNRGSSDKIYMACIRENSSGEYTVIGKWGGRGKSNLQQQIKVSGVSKVEALLERRKIFDQKLKTGFEDIEDASYFGPLSMASPEVMANLEGKSGAVSSVKKPRRTKPKPKPKPEPVEPEDKEVIVECLNNKGIEDKFDVGIEYVGEWHPDKNMVWVWDKFGEKQECFAERFKVVPGV